MNSIHIVIVTHEYLGDFFVFWVQGTLVRFCGQNLHGSDPARNFGHFLHFLDGFLGGQFLKNGRFFDLGYIGDIPGSWSAAKLSNLSVSRDRLPPPFQLPRGRTELRML